MLIKTVNKNIRGFTLIEILVAITIMVATAAAVYQTLKTAITAYRKQESLSYYNQNARQAWRELSRDLRCAFMSPSNDEITFIGETSQQGSTLLSRVQFVTCPSGSSLCSGGLARVEYYVNTDPSASERGLIKVDHGFPCPTRENDFIRKREVAPLVRALRLSYYNGNTWLDEWGVDKPGLTSLQKRSLPLLVKISVDIATTEDGNNLETLSTVVPVYSSGLLNDAKS